MRENDIWISIYETDLLMRQIRNSFRDYLTLPCWGCNRSTSDCKLTLLLLQFPLMTSQVADLEFCLSKSMYTTKELKGNCDWLQSVMQKAAIERCQELDAATFKEWNEIGKMKMMMKHGII